MIRLALALLSSIFLVNLGARAQAHPHVWVSARTRVVFDDSGRILGLKHDWTFDEMYSAFATQGLGENGARPTRAQLQPLAKVNIESLVEFDYFSFAKSGGKRLEFGAPKDYWLDVDESNLVSLHFTLPLTAPLPAQGPFSFQVYDPSYFVAFSFEKKDPIQLEKAPPGCSHSIVEPAPLMAGDSKRLSEAKTENFSPGPELSMKLAPRVVVACP